MKKNKVNIITSTEVVEDFFLNVVGFFPGFYNEKNTHLAISKMTSGSSASFSMVRLKLLTVI